MHGMRLYIDHQLQIRASEKGWPEQPVPGDDIAVYHANMNYYRRWLKEAKEQSVIVYDVPYDLGLHFDVRNWSADMFIEMPCDVEFGWQFKNDNGQWINATNSDLRFIFAKYSTRKVARLKAEEPAKGPIYTDLTEEQMDAHVDALTAPFPQNPQVSAVQGPWSVEAWGKRAKAHLEEPNFGDKTRCEFELFVEKYFGLPADFSPDALIPEAQYFQIVNLLAMFCEEHMDALRAQLAASEKRVTIEWINRKDRMPEPDVRVLTVFQYGAGNQEIQSSFTTKRFPDIFDHFSNERITHWAYMPALPEKVTEDDIWVQRNKMNNL